MPRPELSLVLPIHDGEDILPPLDAFLQDLLAMLPTDTEVLFVDDGSRDGSIEILRRFAAREPRYRIVRLSREFGREHAIAAGMEKSRGRAVVLMNAASQDAPDGILEMVAKWREGYDVVYGRPRPRLGASTFDVLAAKLSERVFAKIITASASRGTGDLCLVSRRVVTTMRGLRETHPFVRGLVAWVGFKQTFVEYDAGADAVLAKTPLRRRLASALDGIASFSVKPLRLAIYFGAFACVASFCCALLAVITHDAATPPGWTSLVVLVSVLFGVSFAILAVLGEYLARVYEQVKARPRYVVAERINFRRRKVENLSTSDLDELPPPAMFAPVAFPPAPPTMVAASPVAIPVEDVSVSRPPPPVMTRPAPTTVAATETTQTTPATPAASTKMHVTPSVPPTKVTPSVPPFKITPSAPPPKVAPSLPTSKAVPSAPPPAMTPSAPPVKAASIAPPSIIRSAPPPKTSSVAPTAWSPASAGKSPSTAPGTSPASAGKSPSMTPAALTPNTPSVKGGSIAPPKTAATTKSPSILPKDAKDTKDTKTASVPPKGAPPTPGMTSKDPKTLFGASGTSAPRTPPKDDPGHKGRK